MTIKDVEKLTGLTAKAIRHYEKEGLICINRDKMNLYRNYSEKDVNTLRKIKLFRYLEFSIEEIKTILQMENNEISEALVSKAEMYEEKIENNKSKKEFCLNMSKEYKKGEIQIEEYEKVIQFKENEEIKDAIRKIETPSIYGMIFQILVFLCPIINLFLTIEMEKWNELKINAILAIASTIILTLSCKKYVYYYKNRKNIVKKRNQDDKFVIPMLIMTFVLTLICCILCVEIIERFIAPTNWLFYQMDSRFEILMIICIVGLIYSLLETLLKLKRKEKINKKTLISILLIAFIGIYIGVTNITFVTEDKVICYAPFNLKGEEYNYKEVSKVEAKFDKKGNFQYTIHIEGKELTFTVTTPNSNIERYEDSYLELEEFDRRLMELNIPKDSDEINNELCELDEIYVDRFLRIIRNK